MANCCALTDMNKCAKDVWGVFCIHIKNEHKQSVSKITLTSSIILCDQFHFTLTSIGAELLSHQTATWSCLVVSGGKINLQTFWQRFEASYKYLLITNKNGTFRRFHVFRNHNYVNGSLLKLIIFFWKGWGAREDKCLKATFALGHKWVPKVFFPLLTNWTSFRGDSRA